MKKEFIIAIMGIFVTISAVYAVIATAPIGVDIAKEKVQEFVNDPSANIQYQNTKCLNIGDYYTFSTGNGQVYVNMYTGVVERASFNDARKSSGEIRPDSAGVEMVAREYAEEKYSGFADMNMQLIKSDLRNHGDAGSENSFIWRENIEGVLTPNTVVVNIHPVSGWIVSYIGIQREINCVLEPELSEEDALKIAEKQFPGIEVTEKTAELTIEYTKPGLQSLTWVITMKGKPKDYVLQGGLVVIDALTGEALMTSPYL
ncbi:PepSY domain-containing protein [Methanogenium cariaci]|jgi:peptidase YpeB-like protein